MKMQRLFYYTYIFSKTDSDTIPLMQVHLRFYLRIQHQLCLRHHSQL